MTAMGSMAAREASVGSLRSKAALVSERQISGFVLDPADLDVRFVVELLLDGYSTQIARANLYDDELRARGFGDGCYRFLFAIDAAIAQSTRWAEVRLANRGDLVGGPIRVALASASPAAEEQGGEARWIGGLRLSGWINNADGGEAQRVRALVDGVVVAESRADLWTHIGEGAAATAVRAFDLNLPLSLADGRLRRARVVDESGRDLPGSPCAFVAFANGLERFLEGHVEIDSERVRGRLFDRLIPQSVPMTDYADWARAYPPNPALSAKRSGIAVLLVGEANLAATLESLDAQVDCEWIAGALGERGEKAAFQADDLRQFLASDAKDSEILIFAQSGIVFHPSALSRLAEALTAFGKAKLAYCDVTIAGDKGADWPIAYSAFDYERMLEQGYGAFVFAARAAHVAEAAGKGVDSLFRLFNMALDGAGPREPNSPVHVPGFLARLPRPAVEEGSFGLARATHAHLEARGISATVKPGYGELFPAARVQRRAPTGKVSILIPTRDRVDLLKPCMESLERTLVGVDAEIIVIDNDSANSETQAYFAEISGRGARVAYVGGPFNYARIIDAGASIARGEFLLLLNNDVEASRAGWLEEMLGRMAESDVGAVGALLVWPSGVIQHGGVVLGQGFAAGHAFNERIEGDSGYADLLAVAHETSAVTAACLLTRRRLFFELGGFDGARFPVIFNDVDFCLRLRERGYRVVFTPHAKLMHRESASRGRDLGPNGLHRHQREVDNLRSVWGETLLDDPFYSPLLSLDGNPYSGLAWPPRSQSARLPLAAPARKVPPGF